MWNRLNANFKTINSLIKNQIFNLKYGRFFSSKINESVASESPLQLIAVHSGISKDFANKPVYENGVIGDDAWFITSNKYFDVMGVADGVGGWRDVGVDPSKFPSGLMRKYQQFVEQEADQLAENNHFNGKKLVDILSKSYNSLVESDESPVGSSTACITLFNHKSNYLHSANLGDSGLAVIRNNKIVHRTQEQQHYFNCPYQIAIYPNMKTNNGKSLTDDPSLADISSFKLVKGDFIVLATDGLWDNINDNALLLKLANLKSFRMEDLQLAANSIVEKTLKYSQDPKYLSPFAMSARKNGYAMNGGKPDDITLILARVDTFS